MQSRVVFVFKFVNFSSENIFQFLAKTCNRTITTSLEKVTF